MEHVSSDSVSSAVACAPQCQRPALKSKMPPKRSLKGPPRADFGAPKFRMHQFLVRSVRCQSHATEMVAQRAPRMYFGAPKAPRGSISESRNSPKRSRRAPGCTPAHRCGPGIPQTRLKSLRSEPGHGFPPLLGHVGDQPSLPAQCPYTVEDPLRDTPSLAPPHTPRQGRRISWPEATCADP